MNAIQVMMDEHRQILRVLDGLDRFADTSTGTPADQLELAHFVKFIREYADDRHHGKEEHVLFQAMMRNGFPPGEGPVGVMLEEHRHMREIVAALRALSDQEAPWSPADLERVAAAARSYTAELREHITKEDEMIYPMAAEQLPPQVQDDVDRACADLDARQEAAGVAAALDKLAAHLVAKYARAR